MNNSLRVVGYVRCSSNEQATDGLSIETQQEKIRAWCAATGAELVEIVEDGGISGTRVLADRPGGEKIVGYVEARRPQVDAVVVVRLDRLGRDAAETLRWVRRFGKGPVGLVSITNRLDLSTAHGRAMAGVESVFAELERALIAERTTEALAMLRGQGRVYGPLAYGYDEHEDYLVRNEREQAVIAAIERLRARGFSYGRIADRLNEKGIKGKRGGAWYATTVLNVLRTSAQLREIVVATEPLREAA